MKYGKIVRIAPSELSILDEAVWNDVWAHRKGHVDFQKDRNEALTSLNGLTGILFAGKENHARYRRLFAPSFSEKGIREQEGIILGYVDALMRGVGKESQGAEAVDMVKWFNVCFFLFSRLGSRPC